MKRFIINAGRLRQTVSVQTRTSNQNISGDIDQDWTTVETRRAAILPLSGNETFESNQTDARLTHRVIMRKQGLTLDPTMRLLFGTRKLNIKAVMNIEERGRKVVVMCIEDVTNQDS